MLIPGNRIHIKADKLPEKTASGLLVVQKSKTPPPYGTVLALGIEAKVMFLNRDGDTCQLAVGDRVMFERYASIVMADDERLCLPSQILGVLEPGEHENDGVYRVSKK